MNEQIILQVILELELKRRLDPGPSLLLLSSPLFISTVHHPLLSPLPSPPPPQLSSSSLCLQSSELQIVSGRL